LFVAWIVAHRVFDEFGGAEDEDNFTSLCTRYRIIQNAPEKRAGKSGRGVG